MEGSMRRSIFLLAVVLTLAMVAVAFAGNPKPVYKVGDEVYACNCGETCPCQAISKKEGKCPCAMDLMVKAKVMTVEKDKVMLKAESWEKPRPFSTVAKFVCDCGPTCNCDAISQTAGKCPCDKEMKVVKK
jgi:hypothetical protein